MQFPSQSRARWSTQPAEAEPGDDAHEERPRRRRQAEAPPDSIPRYVLTAIGMFLAVAALAWLLLQLGQLGKAPPPAPVPTAITQAQQPSASNQPSAPAAPKPGTGELKVKSRVLEPSYTVASGDTLGSIAAKFGTTVEALQSINNLADRNVLSVGQKLVIPNQE